MGWGWGVVVYDDVVMGKKIDLIGNFEDRV